MEEKQVSILITEGNYQDNKTELDEGLYRIEWEGQNKRTTYDNQVDVGTNVFWRHKTEKFYKYLGRVIKRDVIDPRTSRSPIRLKLIVADYGCSYRSNTICDRINHNDSYKYQQACWRSIGLSRFRCNGQAI